MKQRSKHPRFKCGGLGLFAAAAAAAPPSSTVLTVRVKVVLLDAHQLLMLSVGDVNIFKNTVSLIIFYDKHILPFLLKC
jgi:hypothetical protein